MTVVPEGPLLQGARQIGVLGDCHGNLEHLQTALATFAGRGIEVVVQVGDFGFVWPGEWNRTLDTIQGILAGNGQSLYFVDGNHEYFPALYGHPLGTDGLRRLRPRLAHLPRGYRTTLVSGRTVAVLGGAGSVDIALRIPRGQWWQQEAITFADLQALGDEPADILFGHEAPKGVGLLDNVLPGMENRWPKGANAYVATVRRIYQRGFDAVRPALVFCGHYHTFVSEVITTEPAGAEPFETHIVVLDKDRPGISCAILDTTTLGVEAFDRDGKPAR